MSYRSAFVNRTFWFEAADRAVKTAAQAVVLGLGLGEGLNAFAVDWRLAGGFALGGAILSLLTSLMSAGTGTPGNASVYTPRPSPLELEGDGTGRALPEIGDGTEERAWPPDEDGI